MRVITCPLNKEGQQCPPKIINNIKDGISTKMQIAKIIQNGKRKRIKLETTATITGCFNLNLPIIKPIKPRCTYSETSNKDGKARIRLCCN